VRTRRDNVEHILSMLALRSRSQLAPWFVDHAMEYPFIVRQNATPTRTGVSMTVEAGGELDVGLVLDQVVDDVRALVACQSWW
jgi:hypothetical protein